MLLKKIRIICFIAIIAAVTAGISYDVILSGKPTNKTNAILVMAQEELYVR